MKISKADLITDIFQAYYDARKNKRNTTNQLKFEMNMESNLLSLATDIYERTYRLAPSVCFIVTKPVQREIFAADFRDRVVHHLLFNYLNDIFEKTFIPDCYSCRKGLGTSYAVQRIQHHIRSCTDNYRKVAYVLKLDIQGYFMSINRDIMFREIERILIKYANRKDKDGVKWKDRLDMDMIFFLLKEVVYNDPTEGCRIKGSPKDWEGLPPSKSMFNTPKGCGLPIGNLTSQLFSNVYLNSFDHFIKRTLGFKHYGRYVDDFFLIHTDKEKLKKAVPAIHSFLKQRLKLTLHPKKIYLQKCQHGVLFTGGYIKAFRSYANNRIVTNFRKGMENLSRIRDPNPCEIRSTLNSYLGIMSHFKSYKLRKTILTRNAWVFRYGYVQDCGRVFRLDPQSDKWINYLPEK